MTVKLTDANGKGVSNIGGSKVQIALDYTYDTYGCVTLSKYYTTLNAKITRAEYVHIFYNALPEACFNKINYIAAFPDKTVSSSAYGEVLALYYAGVLTGSDSYGNFNPFNYIKRSEVVTIIARTNIRITDARRRGAIPAAVSVRLFAVTSMI